MGLDMYLERMPRMGGVTPFNVVAYDGWVDYMDYMQKPLKPSETDKCTFAEWVGGSVAKNLPNSDVRAELSNFAKTNYYYWDDRHEYPHKTVVEQVGYWRKENAIHNWFVDIADFVDYIFFRLSFFVFCVFIFILDFFINVLFFFY